ncbi:MAG: hypothetical protein ACYC5Y_10355 [Symbiobacteriia bacterium]
MASERYSIVWAPEAIDGLAAIRSEKIRLRIVQRVGLAGAAPGLHKERHTATWGVVYLIAERPFIVVYRYRNSVCEVLDVVDATFMASHEIKE